MLLRNMDICENTYAPPWSTAACLLLRGSESMTDSGLRPQEGITASSKPPHMNGVNPPMLRQRHMSGSGWQESFQERAARRRGIGSVYFAQMVSPGPNARCSSRPKVIFDAAKQSLAARQSLVLPSSRAGQYINARGWSSSGCAEILSSLPRRRLLGLCWCQRRNRTLRPRSRKGFRTMC